MTEFDLDHLEICFNEPVGPWPKCVSVHVNNWSNNAEEFTINDIADLKSTISVLEKGILFLEGEPK